MLYCRVIMLLLLASNTAWCQSDSTKLAAYESLAVPKSNQEVRFTRRITQVGDRIDQQLQAELELESTVRKGQETIEQTNSKVARLQKRAVVVDQVADGKTLVARVHFSHYSKTLDGESKPQSVVGKTYRCERQPDDKLSITTTDGRLTTPDEYTLVSECMESLGRTNPLSNFLAGRTIKVGETFEVPEEVGEALVSPNSQMGKVAKFQLTLTNVDRASNLATLQLALDTQGGETTQMKLSVRGQLVVETDTCRTRSMHFSGPLVMATTIGSYSAAKTSFVRGKLQVNSQAVYSK